MPVCFTAACVFSSCRGKIVLGYTEAELRVRGSGYQFIHAADMLYCAENHVRSESAVVVVRLKSLFIQKKQNKSTTAHVRVSPRPLMQGVFTDLPDPCYRDLPNVALATHASNKQSHTHASVHMCVVCMCARCASRCTKPLSHSQVSYLACVLNDPVNRGFSGSALSLLQATHTQKHTQTHTR